MRGLRAFRGPASVAFAAIMIALCLAGPVKAQDITNVPAAPDSKSAPLVQDWQRFDRLLEVAREISPPERLTDAAKALRANVPAEAGRLSPLDWYDLGNAWWAIHYPGSNGKTTYQDTTAMAGEELYALYRKGYRLNAEQSARVQARLLTLLGVPSESITGVVRKKSLDQGAWVVSQVGETWMRCDLANCLPVPDKAVKEWRPAPAFYQASSDLEGVLAFLKAHLPDGETTARLQGLAKSLSLNDWEAWSKAETRLRERAQNGETGLLFVSKSALLKPAPIADNGDPEVDNTPPPPEYLSALEQLRRKPIKPTRGQRLVETALQFVGLRYTWGGESPNTGFDCSGLMQYVCRQCGIHLPRTAAEQYHVGVPVRFMDLEPGDLVFLANTYKPGVSHVGMYIGEGRWVQACDSNTGIIISDVPYFDAGTGPGARRLNLANLPAVAGEPAPPPKPQRAMVVASRHASSRRAAPQVAGGDPIVQIKVCGDTGELANSGCTTYKLMRVPKSVASRMLHCHRHRPLPGEK